MRTMRAAAAAAGLIALLAAGGAAAQFHGNNGATPRLGASPPSAAQPKGPGTGPSAAAAKAARAAAWKYKDCLRRYKDHVGCRYLAYRRTSR